MRGQFINISFFNIYIWHVDHLHAQCLQRSEEGILLAEILVSGGFELPCCAGNQTCSFCAFYSGAFSLISLCVIYMLASRFYFFSEYVFIVLIC